MKKRLFFCMVYTISLNFCSAQFNTDSNSVKKQEYLHEYKSVKSTPWNWIIPGTLTGLGVWATLDKNLVNRNQLKPDRYSTLPSFQEHIIDATPFLPAATVYLLHAIGKKPSHDVVNYSLILLKSELLLYAVVTPLKEITQVLRPDSSGYRSFPSGHTAQAFLTANFFRHEFGQRNVWYGIAAYTVATAVGISRVTMNKHWVGDVLAGAGIGILCSELVYATHRYRWSKNKNISVLPTFNGSSTGFYMVWNF